ncbi:hypothetical protein [Ruegeria arenilitoris]|uniref:hypothetical protein n=1 Tax=Ruegeria arenilitoris TaxID=1173585 RepID=UPI00147D1CB6|nr:hypothetical protein [Ruegeria arenilitoris]
MGDDSNRAIADQEGWQHFNYLDFRSDLHDEFERVFCPVQGDEHRRNLQFRGGKDWLRFVFERWFHIHGFAQSQNIERFWHFDSDTMILKNLERYEELLERYDYTTQCNATCLNGYIKRALLAEYNAHTISLFKNKDFLERQQIEFDSINPTYAFTEMRAFSEFARETQAKGVHLMSFSSEEVFDDALRQSHGFDVCFYDGDKFVKDIRVVDGNISGVCNQKNISFVTLNMSWLPAIAYKWVFRALKGSQLPLATPLSSSIRRKLGF